MANQQLIDYFKKGIEKNIPLILLKQELIKHGWPQQLVEEAANEVSKIKTEIPVTTETPKIEQTKPIESKKEEKIEAPRASETNQYSSIIKISAIIFLFLVIATSGTFLYSKFISKEVKIQPKETLVVETTKIVSEEAEEIDLANLPKQAVQETQECNFNLNCDDQNPCTTETVDDEACPTSCIYTEIDYCINNDNCCPVGCNSENDRDCLVQETQPGIRTCLEQNGFICNTNEICSQSFIQASDTDRCCPVACSSQVSESPAPTGPPLHSAPPGPG